jgi:hypothetical protein
MLRLVKFKFEIKGELNIDYTFKCIGKTVYNCDWSVISNWSTVIFLEKRHAGCLLPQSGIVTNHY